MESQVIAARKTAVEIGAPAKGPVHDGGPRKSTPIIEDEHDPDDDF
jgi:hypothetical protein